MDASTRKISSCVAESLEVTLHNLRVSFASVDFAGIINYCRCKSRWKYVTCWISQLLTILMNFNDFLRALIYEFHSAIAIYINVLQPFPWLAENDCEHKRRSWGRTKFSEWWRQGLHVRLKFMVEKSEWKFIGFEAQHWSGMKKKHAKVSRPCKILMKLKVCSDFL